MQPDSASAFLYEIARAAETIAARVAGKTLADYQADDLLRDAVERRFINIGEMVHRLTREYPAVAERISERRAILAFRNILVHGYTVVDDNVVWFTIQEKLPTLRAEVAALLAEG